MATATLRLNPSVRGKEPRLAQRVEVTLPGGGRALITNLHCTNREIRADAELVLALPWAREGAGDACVVVAGDFNIVPERSATLRTTAGFSIPIPGSIDQVLVHGAPASARSWPEEERRYGGRLLSDHAPVEATF